jgi:hypothetical protein
MIETKVASCKGQSPAPFAIPTDGIIEKAGYAADQSLRYSYAVQPNGARTVEIKLWNGTVSETVIMDEVAPQ